MTAGRFDRLLAALASDPAIYPHQLDLLTDRVLLTRLPLAAQSEASFLDQRAIRPDTEGAWFAWAQFEAAAAAAPPGAPAYILHIGHCGSTLLSRLVEIAAGKRVLREPLPLRTFAFEAADALQGAALLSEEERRRRLATFERLWSRGGSVVKATSICNDLAGALDANALAAFVFVRPEVHLATLLAGPNSQADLRGFAQMRYRRLKARHPEMAALSSLRAGELAALCWLTETASIAEAERKLHAVDFDGFLVEPAPALAALSAHLGSPADEKYIEAALAGPTMSRYAKAPEHGYDAAMRRQVLDEARRKSGEEIARGLSWLEREGQRFRAGAIALERFG